MADSSLSKTPQAGENAPMATSMHQPLGNKAHVTNGQDSAATPLPVAFYRAVNPQKDDRGRTLNLILSWPDRELERCHNYIQYLFPLPERSPFNPFAPIVTEEVFEAFRANNAEGEGLRNNLRRAFGRMLTFYGFRLDELSNWLFAAGKHQPCDMYKVSRSADFKDRSKDWVRPFDHNHLRISRMIRCLRLLGLEQEAEAFYEALLQLSISLDLRNIIQPKSIMFWRRAATRELWKAPEDEEGAVRSGCEFLFEWEKRKKNADVEVWKMEE